VKLNDEIVLQRTNHLHHIEENTAKTVSLLEAWSKEQQETNDASVYQHQCISFLF